VELRAKWIWATGRKRGNIPNVDNISFCSRHFAPDAYNLNKARYAGSYLKAKGRILQPGGTPTLRLAFSKPSKSTARGNRQDAKERKRVVNEAMDWR